MNKKTLADLLEVIGVLAPGQWENDQGPRGWWAVCTEEDGIIAYFGTEERAFWFRLALINARLNEVK